jgi:hypothetical protein
MPPVAYDGPRQLPLLRSVLASLEAGWGRGCRQVMADQGYAPGPDTEAWPLMTLGCIGLPSGIPEGACSGKHSLTGRQMIAISSAMVTSAGTVGRGCDQRRKAHSRRSGEAWCNEHRVPPPATRSTASLHGGGPHRLNCCRSGLCPGT